nr:aminopeptidase N [Arthrobacter roseus]
MVTNENLSRSEAAQRSAIIRVDSYDVSVDLRDAATTDVPGFTSQSIIDFSCSEPGASTFLDFISGGVHSVSLNGAQLAVADVVDGARIHLPGLERENQVTVIGTALYSRSGEGMHRFVDPADGQTYLYTQYEPADSRRVFANFEQPDLKASFTFHVTAPVEWKVGTNGAEVARTGLESASGFARWDFAPTQRISTYITTILAGPYHFASSHWSRTFDDGETLEVPLGAYCRASLAEHFDADAIFDVTRRGLDYFHDVFDYPYPFGKYDQAFVPEYNLGAMENPGLVTFTEAYIYRSRATTAQYEARANTTMHEMAHMWFGDLVTMFWWDDLWLKESFADFMGTLAVAEATDWDTSWVTFANQRKAWAYVQDQLPTTHPIVADIPDLEAAKQNFDGITYAKGASVLKQLVAYVGFDAFKDAARQYFRDHEYGNTSLSDLLAALSKASGRDMSDWSRQWLQTAGVPVLGAEVETDDDGLYQEVTIIQESVDPITGQDSPRPHRLRVGLYDLGTDGILARRASHELDVTGHKTVVDVLTGQPTAALLLVNDDDLTYAKIRFDPESLKTLLESLERIPDPLARAVCLSALWNSVRDGILSAADYIRAVLRIAPAESGVGVLQVLLTNTRTALSQFVPEADRESLTEELYDSTVAQLQGSLAGSDLQLAWARSAARLGRRSDRHNELLAGLLDGSRSVDGLTIDAELRWLILQALAATGNASQEQLEDELRSDNTASGKTGYCLASAARPRPDVKERAWAEAVQGSSLSNEHLSATIEGFMEGSHELLDPFLDDYFACLEQAWSAMSIELASRVVRGLYPGVQNAMAGENPAKHPVIIRTDTWLSTNADAPRALRRIILEQRDQLLRSLRAQHAAIEAGAMARG